MNLPEIGATVDGFEIGERVHEGGMGVLFRVRAQEDPGFPLVMKVPRLGPGEPASSIVTFEVELMVLQALRGPHVPRFVAAGDLARQPYLVMEYVEGATLQERVGAPLPPDEVARIGAATAAALHSLHLQGAIHLDVKPANVILRPSGEAVLVDFGLAHHAQLPDLLAEELRRPVGSAPYISPEQVLGARNDPRSDLFSLGVVLYELATGALPFGRPGAAKLRRRLWRDPDPPRALVPSVPEWLQEVILRCLEVEPAQRYGSAAQVALDLAHPDQVAIGDRGRRTRRLGAAAAVKRWFRAAGMEAPEGSAPFAHLPGASIVLAAVATSFKGDDAQQQAIRDVVRHLMAAGSARLAAVTVIRPSSELGGSTAADAATSRQIQHLLLLRQWAEPLALAPGRISFHVLEAKDPADALLDYARVNGVDHVVIGAPPRDLPLKSVLRTVSTKVAADARCTVTVARPRGGA
jgi:nucleotide-binding universal stress UspA family protein